MMAGSVVDSMKKKKIEKRHRKDKRERKTDRGQRMIKQLLVSLSHIYSKITLYNKYTSNLSDFASEGKL